MTNHCCNNCDFCLRKNSPGSLYAENLWYQGGEPHQGGDLGGAVLPGPEPVLRGGVLRLREPACRWDDMMWLCDKIKEAGSHLIRINTNGLGDLITGRPVAEELDGRADTVSVSLNASTPEGYDRLCHSKYGLQALPAILKFTAMAVLNVPHVRMTVVSTMPKEEIDACRALCESIGADFFVREYIEA